jgi:PTH2 family peptidyl-tRNA hydrolase
MASEYKQVIVVRKDLNMPAGKLAAQVAHASLSAYLNAPSKARETWSKTGQAKVILKVFSEDELMDVYAEAREWDLPAALITDQGRTVFHGQATHTCVGIGPAPTNFLDKITGHLKLY